MRLRWEVAGEAQVEVVGEAQVEVVGGCRCI